MLFLNQHQKKLTLEGKIVISVGLFGHSGDTEEVIEKYRDNIQFYLMGKENKMLITFDKNAYIVDISDLK